MLAGNTKLWGALLLLFAVACASKSGGVEVVSPEGPQRRDSVSVSVINDHWEEVRVYAVYGVGAMRYPLGVVGNKREAGPFTIPYQEDWLTMEVHFVLGSGKYLSDRVDVDPGDFVQLRVPANISSSGFFTPIP